MQYGRDVSTRQIAEAAGIAEGTIFRVFPNKDAVIEAVIEDTFDDSPTVVALTAIDPAQDLPARLAAAVEVLQARMRRVISLVGALHRSPQSPPADTDNQGHKQRGRADNALITTALIAVIGSDARRLRVPAPQAADLIRGLVFAIAHPAVGATIPAEPRVIVDLLLNGILTPTNQESPC